MSPSNMEHMSNIFERSSSHMNNTLMSAEKLELLNPITHYWD